jgi:hypothetical protein
MVWRGSAAGCRGKASCSQETRISSSYWEWIGPSNSYFSVFLMVTAGIGMTSQEGEKGPEMKSEAQIPIHFFLKSMKYREFNML